MKHDWKVSLQLLGWVLVSILFSLWVYPYVAVKTGGPSAPWYVMLPLIVAIMAVSFFAWNWLMKRKKSIEATRYIFSITIGLVLGSVLEAVFFRHVVQSALVLVLVRLVLTVAFGMAFYYTTRQMAIDWKWTRRLTPVSNLFFAVVISLSAIIVAHDLTPKAAIALLVLASVYDAWAVWRSKSMVKMANFFKRARVFPGVIIPKEGKKNQFGMIGGGDIFFIVLVAMSFAKDAVLMYWFAFAMFGGLCALMFMSEPKKFYPALPFILLGLIAGWLAGLLGSVVNSWLV